MILKNHNNFGNEITPLYKRIELLLRNMIINGQFEPGEKFLTEESIVQKFKVSKITVRSALSLLKNEGLIFQERGKGTFLTKKKISPNAFGFSRIQETITNLEKYSVNLLCSQIIKTREARYPKKIETFFNLSRGEDIYQIKRLRVLKKTPIAFLENCLPITISENIPLDELKGNKTILRILKEKNFVNTVCGEMTIEALPADIGIAQNLQCQTFAPVVLVQTHYRTSAGDPIELVNCFVRPEYFRFKIYLDNYEIGSINSGF